MIEAVELRNFRSFEKADLSDCTRINIVVGDNGSGKTALLEGLLPRRSRYRRVISSV